MKQRRLKPSCVSFREVVTHRELEMRLFMLVMLHTKHIRERQTWARSPWSCRSNLRPQGLSTSTIRPRPPARSSTPQAGRVRPSGDRRATAPRRWPRRRPVRLRLRARAHLLCAGCNKICKNMDYLSNNVALLTCQNHYLIWIVIYIFMHRKLYCFMFEGEN